MTWHFSIKERTIRDPVSVHRLTDARIQLIFRIILGSRKKTVECIFIKSSGFHGKWSHYFFWNGRLLLTLPDCFSYCAKTSSWSRNKYTSDLLLKAALKWKFAVGQSDLPSEPKGNACQSNRRRGSQLNREGNRGFLMSLSTSSRWDTNQHI